jgi:alkaline phosphatase D
MMANCNQGLPEFPNLPVRDMIAIGTVTSTSARIWIRSEHYGKIRILAISMTDNSTFEVLDYIQKNNKQDNTLSVLVPKNPNKNPLRSITGYKVYVYHVESGQQIGAGEFETAPSNQDETASTFSIGLLSCHQPFTEKKVIRPIAGQVLKSAIQVFKRHNTKFILEVGDQMYADYPQSLSFFKKKYFSQIENVQPTKVHECSAAQIRQLYQLRYRHYWNMKYWKKLHTSFPTYPILDDHDIVDNWGADKNFQQSTCKDLGDGARWAYWDYQGSRIAPVTDTLPDNFQYEIDYGPLSIFFMDLRSNRRVGSDSQMVDDNQIQELEDFLWRNRQKKILFVVLSVPIIHLSRHLAKAVAQITDSNEDFSDRWSTRGHLEDRDKILELIHRFQIEFPDIKVVIPSGDIHIGCAHKIQWNSGVRLYQLISSAITHQMPLHVEIAGEVAMRLNTRISTNNGKLSGRVQLLESEGNYTNNPTGKLNFGVIEMKRKKHSDNYSMKYFLYTSKNSQPKCVYRSPEL